MSAALRVLSLEDDPRDAEILQTRLEEEGLNFDFHRVETEEAFSAALDQRTFDVILADYSLPSYDGMSALKLTRARELDVPFIFVSGTIGEDRAIEAVKSGATDYVLKDGLNRLVPAIRRALAEVEERRRCREAERAQRASEAKFRDFFNFLPIPLFEVDTSGRFLMVNRSFVDTMGFEHGDPGAEKNAFDLLPPEEVDRARENFRLRLCGAETGSNEFLAKTQGGALRTFIIATSAIVQEDRPIGLRGIAMDITERKRAEAERDRLAVAIEQAAETVMVADAEGTIQYVNPIFETVTGYTRAEAVGQNPRLLKSGEQDATFYRGLWETITAGRVWEGQLVNRRKDGSLYTEDATISPVRDATGRIVNYVAVKRDVTEHLRQAAETALLEDQLRQSQKVEAIGRLAGGVAHDFNNITAIILGYSEMVLGELGPQDSTRKWVEQIVAAGNRSAALTRQLLAFSRKQVLLPKVLDLNALLLDLEKLLGRAIGEDIAMKIVPGENLGHVMADPGQIGQVITNLVLNARDAMPRGGSLTVETANVELDETYQLSHESVIPGRYVQLALSDTGCGMDKQTMTHLFEPFYTTKEQGKGTGLGLASSLGIVKQSGGYIWAYSEPGQGTSFKIYLPRTDAELTGIGFDGGGEVARGNGERILLVEDDAPLSELCETALVRLGYRVNAARGGPEALRQVREQGLEPDLVLTDVIMPGMSGPEMAQQLRNDRPDIKVLYMSGYPDEAIARHCILGPEIPFIPKPFTERALAVKLREVLGGAATPTPRGPDRQAGSA